MTQEAQETGQQPPQEGPPQAASGPQGDEVAVVKGVGTLPAHIQQRIALRKIERQTAAAIRGQTWGKDLTPATIQALANWALQMGVDAATEIDVLGGNIYLNSKFYLNRLAALAQEGKVEYAYADHVEIDARLEQDKPGYAAERDRREQQRIMHGLPDSAQSAVVFHVKLKDMAHEVAAAKWAGGRGQNQYGKMKDPVGEEFPHETAETRAARRACRLLIGMVPEAEQWSAVEESAKANVGVMIHDDTDNTRRALANTPAPSPMRLASGYGEPQNFARTGGQAFAEQPQVAIPAGPPAQDDGGEGPEQDD